MFGKFLHKRADKPSRPAGIDSMPADQYNDYIRNVVYPNMRKELEGWVTSNVAQWDDTASKPYRDNVELIPVDFRISLHQPFCHAPFLKWLAKKLSGTVTLFDDLNGKYRVELSHVGSTYALSVHVFRKYLESKD